MKFFKRIIENRKLTFVILIVLSITSTGIFGFVYLNSKKPNKSIKYNIGNKYIISKDKTNNQKSTKNSSSNQRLSKAEFSVKGLSCSSCVQDIKDALANIDGIKNILVDVSGGTAQIYFDNKKIKDAQFIADKITKDAGYPAYLSKVLSSDEIQKETEYKNKMKDLYIASVGGWDISRSDYEIEIESYKKRYQQKYGENIFSTPQGLSVENNIKVQVVNQLISEGIILQDISKANYKISKAVVNDEIQKYLKDKSLTLNKLIESSGYPKEYYMKKIANSILINHYIKDIVFSNVTSKAQQQNEYYQWFNNIKSLAKTTYYDTGLEQLLVNTSSSGASCCD